jgi:hypothetical protein
VAHGLLQLGHDGRRRRRAARPGIARLVVDDEATAREIIRDPTGGIQVEPICSTAWE